MKTRFSIIKFFDPFGDLKSDRKQLFRENYESKKSLTDVKAIITDYNGECYYNAVEIMAFDERKKSISNFDESIYIKSKAMPAEYKQY